MKQSDLDFQKSADTENGHHFEEGYSQVTNRIEC